MALMQCPECGKDISDKAECCPSCGAPNTSINKSSTIPTPTKPASKRFGCGIIAIVILVGLYFIGNSGQNNNGTGSSTQSSSADSSVPEYTLSAENLFRRYSENEVSADLMYKGKLLQVSGVVDSIGKDIIGSSYVTLKTSTYGANVQCFFENDKLSALASLSKGMTLTVKGTCSGKMMNVLLKKCVMR